ncbi:MAG: helix-turn-helix domain-containing protein [Spirochaetaceae bacterium]|jgi:transcriptional regulator with XRE-family HTH domain|nr:helix-turn-helix domain-containing protein [Spirochaetaceae bacterium]
MRITGIYGRVYELRNLLNLKQKDFASALGLTNAAVSMMERGINPLTEANLRLICLTFNVNEKWFRTGKGEVFNLADKDPIINEVIELTKQMNREERRVVLNYVRWYFSQQQALAGLKTTGVPPPGDSVLFEKERVPE